MGHRRRFHRVHRTLATSSFYFLRCLAEEFALANGMGVDTPLTSPARRPRREGLMEIVRSRSTRCVAFMRGGPGGVIGEHGRNRSSNAQGNTSEMMTDRHGIRRSSQTFEATHPPNTRHQSSPRSKASSPVRRARVFSRIQGVAPFSPLRGAGCRVPSGRGGAGDEGSRGLAIGFWTQPAPRPKRAG